MLPEKVARSADELRERLDAGVLSRLGRVELDQGVTFAFEVAVRIALADLDDLSSHQQRGEYVSAGRWRDVAEEVERLHGLAMVRA